MVNKSHDFLQFELPITGKYAVIQMQNISDLGNVELSIDTQYVTFLPKKIIFQAKGNDLEYDVVEIYLNETETQLIYLITTTQNQYFLLHLNQDELFETSFLNLVKITNNDEREGVMFGLHKSILLELLEEPPGQNITASENILTDEISEVRNQPKQLKCIPVLGNFEVINLEIFSEEEKQSSIEFGITKFTFGLSSISMVHDGGQDAKNLLLDIKYIYLQEETDQRKMFVLRAKDKSIFLLITAGTSTQEEIDRPILIMFHDDSLNSGLKFSLSRISQLNKLENMKELIKQQLEETFERIIKETFESNPMKGTPLEGMMILKAITTITISSKEGLVKNAGTLEFITEIEINNMVDEISNKMREKYLRM